MIAYKGMNCHLAALVNIAHDLGINTPALFYNLWSETDFLDNLKYNIYTSKRVYKNLSAFGITTQTQTDAKYFAQTLQALPEGDFLLLGIDIYFIPWHPVYGHFHGPHFIAGKKTAPGVFTCVDPIYRRSSAILSQENILCGAFEMTSIKKSHPSLQEFDCKAEPLRILQNNNHQYIMQHLHSCKSDRQGLDYLRKYTTAMLNNRLMYSKFLENTLPSSEISNNLFSEDFFKKWAAIQNGLIKISVISDFSPVVDEVYKLMNSVFQEELRFAEILLSFSNGFKSGFKILLDMKKPLYLAVFDNAKDGT